jgi:hypothetical protein
MKKASSFFLLFILSISFAFAQQTQTKKDLTGNWKFDAPYAPEGYTAGTITIGIAEQKHTATMMFAGSEYKLTGEKVVVDKDSLSFAIFLEGQDIKVFLKMESDTKMSGKAVYSEGEVPLTLTKVPPAAQK